ncbi:MULTISPECIES: hypothetical protein [Variovorax]|uniref:hypothetical protein n=1 Tax=Variovorax TaxID=34072 RepID=UPI00285C9E47|nr:hypothetical protein [Variovorax sp. 3319]MDR6886114.1 putative alpha/beta superfamily hydrolase [Variovorax sp. 3319]
MTPIQKLVHRQRAHLILAEGLGIEICMALGDREGAHRHRREMEAQIAARDAAIQQAEEEGESYFSAAGAAAHVQAKAKELVG